MSELLDRQGIIDEAALRAGLEALDVRPSFISRVVGTGTTGVFVPTRKEWETGRIQAIGRDISEILESDETVLRIKSRNDAGLPRRRETLGRFGLTYELMRADGPIHGAEVTGLTNEGMGVSWSRTLPVLRVMEFNSQASEEIFALSLADMAYYLKSGQAEIEIV